MLNTRKTTLNTLLLIPLNPHQPRLHPLHHPRVPTCGSTSQVVDDDLGPPTGQQQGVGTAQAWGEYGEYAVEVTLSADKVGGGVGEGGLCSGQRP